MAHPILVPLRNVALVDASSGRNHGLRVRRAVLRCSIQSVEEVSLELEGVSLALGGAAVVDAAIACVLLIVNRF